MPDAPSEAQSHPVGGNEEQSRYWNEVAGPRWVAAQERLDRQIRPLGLAALDWLGIEAGQRVLDVGCGCGDTSLELAGRVGEAGFVRGIDLSEPMLEHARDRARTAGIRNLELQHCDAQATPLGLAEFDRVFSRFGVMFFADPVAAFRNLGRSLRPGGRLGFVCWQEIARNPYFHVPLAAAAAHVDLPPRGDPHAPGPFALADPGRLRGILEKAGIDEIEIENHDAKIPGRPIEEALDFYLEIGPLGALLREREASHEVRRQVREAVREALAPFERDGAVHMPAAVWLVRARPS